MGNITNLTRLFRYAAYLFVGAAMPLLAQSASDPQIEAGQYGCAEAQELAQRIPGTAGASCHGYITAIVIHACRDEMISGGADAASIDASLNGAVNAYVSLASSSLSVAQCTN